MKKFSSLNWLIPLIALLALIVSGAGLFAQGGGGDYAFTTLHGLTVKIYGQGIYQNDTLFTAMSFTGTDAVMLLLALPLLLVGFVLYRRGSLRGAFLLAGALSNFLYYSATLAFGAAYNNLFLVYVAYFSASLAGFVLAFASIDLAALSAHLTPRMPQGGLAAFLFVAGLAPLGLWLSDVVAGLVAGRAPDTLGSYTTLFTYAIDLGVIVPAVFLAVVLVVRRKPLGYLLGFIMLTLLAVTGMAVIGQTVAQTNAGISFSTGQMIGMIGSWVVLAVAAVGMDASILRHLA
jgi:hypothetical protein